MTKCDWCGGKFPEEEIKEDNVCIYCAAQYTCSECGWMSLTVDEHGVCDDCR